MLIAHGRNDPKVKEQESLQIVEALKRNQQPVTYVLLPDEGHGGFRPENMIALLAIAENFLAKELGGKCQEIGDAVKHSSVILVEGENLSE